MERGGELEADEGRFFCLGELGGIEGEFGILRVRQRAGDGIEGRKLNEFANGESACVFVCGVQIGFWPWFAPGEGFLGLLRLAVADAEDATTRAMDAGGLVAFAGVAPVEDEAAAIGAGAEFDATEPRIVAEKDIGLVFANVAAAVALQALHIGAAAVHVEGEELVAV